MYVPLLPQTLIEMLNSPTPFVMGVHSSLKAQIADVVDVRPVVAELDEGSVDVPEHVSLAKIPEPYYGKLLTWLTLVWDRCAYACLAVCAFPFFYVTHAGLKL